MKQTTWKFSLEKNGGQQEEKNRTVFVLLFCDCNHAVVIFI